MSDRAADPPAVLRGHDAHVLISLVELVRPPGERFWFPFDFDEAGNGFNLDWWHNGPVYPDARSTFLRIVDEVTEVCRVHLSHSASIDHYADVPVFGATCLEIAFIEVRAGLRRRGIGGAVIELLAERYSDRRMVAFSEGADGFWAGLGWSRHLPADPEDVPFFRPLFIQPS